MQHAYDLIVVFKGSQTGQIVGLNVTGCTKPPCIFLKGNNYTMDLMFTSKVDSTSALNEVYGIIAGDFPRLIADEEPQRLVYLSISRHSRSIPSTEQ